MQQHLFISVPEPCHENWEEMTPEGAGRFCSYCSKTVVDFTHFTDAQLYQYFEGRKESVCGRLQVSQVNRIIPIPPQPNSRLYRIAIALGLTILVAQGSDVKAMPRAPFAAAATIIDSPFVKQEVVDSTTGIKGTVTDKKKEPLINASVVVKQNGLMVGGGVTDFDGNFMIANLDSGVYDVTVSLLGYVSQTRTGIIVVKERFHGIDIVMATEAQRILTGGMVIRYYPPLSDPYVPDKIIIRKDRIKNLPY